MSFVAGVFNSLECRIHERNEERRTYFFVLIVLQIILIVVAANNCKRPTIEYLMCITHWKTNIYILRTCVFYLKEILYSVPVYSYFAFFFFFFFMRMHAASDLFEQSVLCCNHDMTILMQTSRVVTQTRASCKTRTRVRMRCTHREKHAISTKPDYTHTRAKKNIQKKTISCINSRPVRLFLL